MRWRVTGMHAAQAARLLKAAVAAGDEVVETTDMEGVQEVLAGQADHFIGICATGTGGALAMAQVFAGQERCLTVTAATPPAAIASAAAAGVRFFGVPADRLEAIMGLLAEALSSSR
ncbi:MAG: DUF2620 family protein [Pseudarthrobacter sp.]